MTQHHLPYVSDNPFRLLGLPSATPIKDMQYAARRINDRLRRGQRHDVAMARQWGDEALDQVAMVVQKMAEDPILRCIYRLFWPLDRECLTGLPKADEYDGRHPAQIDFLNMFFFTQSAPDATLLGLMPRRWRAFREEASSRIRLRRLLHQEEGCGPQAADDLLAEAWRRAPDYIVAADLQWARTMWEAENAERACKQIAAVLHTWDPPSRTLDWFVDEADRLALSLKSDSVPRLARLAEVLSETVSESIRNDWAEAIREFEKRRPRPVRLRPGHDKFTQLLASIRLSLPQAHSIVLFANVADQLEALAISSPHLPKGVMSPLSGTHGLMGKALSLGQPLVCADTEQEGVRNFLPERGVLVVPLGTVGCLYLGGNENTFGESDLLAGRALAPALRAALTCDPRMRRPFGALTLSEEVVAALKMRCELEDFGEGETVLEEGEELEYHLIVAGSAERSHHGHTSELSAGAEFGMEALVDEVLSSTTVRAREPVTVQTLRKADFEILCRRYPELEPAFRDGYAPQRPAAVRLD